MLEKLDAVVLKTQDYGESHKIITLFTKKLGKLSALARGAKKPKSRMSSVTQPFINATFFVYVNEGLSTIQQGEIVESYRNIREDIIKTAYGAYVLELTDKLMDQSDPDYFLYDQLITTLQWIADHDDSGIPIIMYELKLFAKGGFAPEVRQCVWCGENHFPFSFSVVEGGLLCKQHSHLDVYAYELPDTLAKWLTVFQQVGLERVGSISMKESNQKLLWDIMDSYYDHYGGYRLKSRRFLRQMDQLM